MLIATRFVKCEKCHHFFVVIPENESKRVTKDGLQDDKPLPKRKPPPPPKKVSLLRSKDVCDQHFKSILVHFSCFRNFSYVRKSNDLFYSYCPS